MPSNAHPTGSLQASACPTPRRSEQGVTICIPNWNHRCFLPRAVHSGLAAVRALAEHGVEGEVLVVDDHSRDGSPSTLLSLLHLYPDAPLRVVFQPRNSGLPHGRNTGLANARYRYVCMLDADNTLIPGNLIYFYRTFRDTGAAMVYGNLVGVLDTRDTFLLSNHVAGYQLINLNTVDAFSLVDAEAVNLSGGYIRHAQLHGVEDWEMVLHLLCEGHMICFVPVLLGNYYKYQLSMVNEVEQTEKLARVMRRRFDQVGIRSNDPRFTAQMYHPDVGYLG